MGEFSKELCAGTHVSRTGELGAAFIVAESGIGSGMRRIEMICGRPAYRYARTRNQQVASLAARLGTTPEQLSERVEGLLAELREARRERAGLESALAQQQAQDLAQQVRTVDGVPVLAARVQAPSMDALLGIKDVLRQTLPSGVLVLGAVIEERPQFVVSVSQDLISPGFDAASIIKEVAAATGGSGGGRPELARAGGRDPAKLDAALALAEDIVRGRAER
jgi:alanyl-tRNA synthetase